MTYGEEHQLAGAKFEKKEVQNRFLSAEDIADLGVTAVEPNVDPGKFSAGTVRDFQAKDGEATNRSHISPTQKDVVENYFSK